ncbi:MAG: DUF1993 domain-containing protein [Pseudomonadota bacterium]
MTQTLSAFLLPTLDRALAQLVHILDRGEAHAAERSFDSATVLALRLFPDMLPLSFQFVIASDVAQRGTARLAGLEPEPAPAPTEATFAAYRAYVENARNLVGGRDAAAIDASAEKTTSFPIGRDRTAEMTGADFARRFILPNVFFHATTAYALFRQAGAPLGKADFLGDV